MSPKKASSVLSTLAILFLVVFLPLSAAVYASQNTILITISVLAALAFLALVLYVRFKFLRCAACDTRIPNVKKWKSLENCPRCGKNLEESYIKKHGER